MCACVHEYVGDTSFIKRTPPFCENKKLDCVPPQCRQVRCSSICMYVCVYIYMCVYICFNYHHCESMISDTHMHRYLDTYLDTYIPFCRRPLVDLGLASYTHVHLIIACIHTHTHVQTYMCITYPIPILQVSRRFRTCIHTYIHTCVGILLLFVAHAHTYTCTHIDTYIHAHIYIHT